MKVFHRQILILVSSLNSKGTISLIPVHLRIRSRGMQKQEQFLLVSQQLNRPSLSQIGNVVPSLKTRIHSRIPCISRIDKYLPDKEIRNQRSPLLRRAQPTKIKEVFTIPKIVCTASTTLIPFCLVLVKQESWVIKTIAIKLKREENKIRSKKTNNRTKNRLKRRSKIL